MLNRVILQGNIGRNPKVCLTQEGKEIITFSLATTQNWRDETGEWQSATDWHHIVVFRESTIKWMKNVLRRGDPVYLEGKLSYHQWIDKYGQKRYTPHVVISGRDGRIKDLRFSVPNHNVIQPSHLSFENQTTSSDSEQKDESTDLSFSQEELQPLSNSHLPIKEQ